MAVRPDRVIVVRHGETEWNTEGRRQGQLDSPLTSQGRDHAAVIAEICSGLGVDRIFTSPLGRTRETAAIISSVVDRRVFELPGLAEIHHGSFAGLTNDEIEQRHPGALARRSQEKYMWAFPGGESYADGAARAGGAIKQIKTTDATVPLLVTHEMIGRMVLGQLLDLEPNDALALSLPHGTVFEVWRGQGRMRHHTSPTQR